MLTAESTVGLYKLELIGFELLLKFLHEGLRTELRVQYKLCVMMHSIHYHWCPSYVASIVSTVADQSTRPGLRSAQTARYFFPTGGTLGERAFSYSGPAVWNQSPQCDTI